MFRIVDGGITSPKGFMAAGCHAGLKKKKNDMALIYSEADCISAATYTTNVVKAAPVLYDMSIAASVKRGFVVNSGNANACTGEQGKSDAKTMARLCEESLGAPSGSFFVASTGVIGQTLPMEKIEGGIKTLVSGLKKGREADDEASSSILTTDTFKKEVAVETVIGGKSVVIGAIAKGSGMIHPNMATMLCFVTTDANIEKETLQRLLGSSVEDSFNMISVDGDTSTNDSCIILANALAGNPLITKESEGYDDFKEALAYVLGYLAKQITKDGEGAGRFIEVKVKGAATRSDARLMARSVVSSNLVKAAFFGSDANWGRILCAMGYSGAKFDPECVRLTFSSAKGEILVLDGSPVAFSEEKAKEILLEKTVNVDIVLGDGEGEATAWGCDLTYDYVKINGDYRS